VTDPDFDEIGQLLAEHGPAGFDLLAQRFIASGNFPGAFEARLMRKRVEMGLPLMSHSQGELSPEDATSYADAQIAAAREIGGLYLGRNDIRRAWPYFRAIGETALVKDAIEKLSPETEGDLVDGAIEVAFYEAVHPEKGLALLLNRHGICRAITTFGQYPSLEGRDAAGAMLIRTIYDELRGNLLAALEIEDSKASLLELVEAHEELFEGNASYIDVSHVISVLRYAVDLEDPPILRMSYELTEYGRRLGEMYQFKGQFPFEEPFLDYGAYLQALLGINVDAAVERFRAKVSPEPDPYGDIAAQTLVNLLVRLGRLPDAIDLAEERLAGIPLDRLICPGPLELCERAGDFDRLKSIALKTNNRIAYAAALVSSS
jgi:hypothetical protein